MNFTVCENCGAHLDPGEKCDCQDQPCTHEIKGSDCRQTKK